MRSMLGVMVLILAVFVGAVPRISAQDGVFFGGGGPIVLGALLDLSELEHSLQGMVKIQGDFKLGTQPIFLMRGGGGFGGSGLRLGGMGVGGQWAFPTSQSEFDRLTLTLGGGGLLVDQVVTEADRGGLSLGLVIGGGNWSLRLEKGAQGHFEDLVRQPLSLELNRSFWFAMPYANGELKVLEFMGLRVGAGFWFALSFEDWKLPNGQTATGGPLKSAFFPVLQLMLVFGG